MKLNCISGSAPWRIGACPPNLNASLLNTRCMYKLYTVTIESSRLEQLNNFVDTAFFCILGIFVLLYQQQLSCLVSPQCSLEDATSRVASMLTVNTSVFLHLQLVNKLVVKLAIHNT